MILLFILTSLILPFVFTQTDNNLFGYTPKNDKEDLPGVSANSQYAFIAFVVI
jgi:hypothetical protein